jgi:hypothetical protein
MRQEKVDKWKTMLNLHTKKDQHGVCGYIDVASFKLYARRTVGISLRGTTGKDSAMDKTKCADGRLNID